MSCHGVIIIIWIHPLRVEYIMFLLNHQTALIIIWIHPLRVEYIILLNHQTETNWTGNTDRVDKIKDAVLKLGSIDRDVTSILYWTAAVAKSEAFGCGGIPMFVDSLWITVKVYGNEATWFQNTPQLIYFPWT